MQCVILCGGVGSRLAPVWAGRPKHLVPVAGRPFARWQIERLVAGGVTSIVECVGLWGDLVRSELGNGSSFGVPIVYSDDGPEPLGTGGAIRRALDADLLDHRFLLVYGDSYVSIDTRALSEAHRRGGRPLTMCVIENRDAWDVSNVVVEGDRVAIYDKSRPWAVRDRMTHVDYGVAVMDRSVAEGIPPGGFFDLAELYRGLSESGDVTAVEMADRFYEVGTPASLAELDQLLGGRELCDTAWEGEEA